MKRRVSFVLGVALAVGLVAGTCLGAGGPGRVAAWWTHPGSTAPGAHGPVPDPPRPPGSDDPGPESDAAAPAPDAARDTGGARPDSLVDDARATPEVRPAPVPVPVDVVAYVGLAEERAHVTRPRWSTDGRLVAVTVRAGESAVVRVASVTLPVVVPVASPALPGGTGTLEHPSWHRDGVLVMQGRAPGGTSRLFLAEAGSVRINEAIPDGGALTQPDVSGDGRFVAFVTDASGGGDVAVWDRTMGWTTTVSHDDAAEHHPAFAPDGRTLLWLRDLGRGTREVVAWDRIHEREQPFETLPLTVRAARMADHETVVYHAVRRGAGVLEAWDEAHGFRRLADGTTTEIGELALLVGDRPWAAWTPDVDGNEHIGLVTLDGVSLLLDAGYAGAAEPALTRVGRSGPVLLAFTALPHGGAWRALFVADVTALVGG